MPKQSDTRTKLLEVAIQLLWKSGYTAVGVAEICKGAGVTKGTFYHHFETKADLFYAASKHYWHNLSAEFEAVLSPSCEPLEQLENYLQMTLKRQSSEISGDNAVKACPFFNSGSQVGSGEELVRLAVNELSEGIIKYNAAMVRSLKGGGYLADDIDPLQTGRILHHFMHGLLTYGSIQNSSTSIRQDLRKAVYRIVGLKPELWQQEE